MKPAPVIAVVLAVAACGDSPTAQPEAPKQPADAAPADAGLSSSEVPRPPWPRNPSRAKPIDVLLKSSPPGAHAYVDGYSLGKTPTQWPGENDGREHVFEFTHAGHITARYQFIPITNGVVHARLEPLPAGVLDAGLPAEPTFIPDAAPVAPDAAPRSDWRPPRVVPDAAIEPPPADAAEATPRPTGAGPEP